MRKTGVFLIALFMLIIGILIGYSLAPYKQAGIKPTSVSEEVVPKHEVFAKTGSMWKLKWERKFDYPVDRVVISPNGQYIFGEIFERTPVVKYFWFFLSTNGSLLWIKEPDHQIGPFPPSVNDDGTVLLPIESLGRVSIIWLDAEGKLTRNLSISVKDFSSSCVQGVPSGDKIIAVSRRKIGLFDLNGNEKWHWRCLSPIHGFSISADGRYIAVVDDSWIYLLDRSGELIFDKNLREELEKISENHVIELALSASFIPSKNVLLVASGSQYYDGGFFGLLDLNGSWLLKPQRINYSVYGEDLAVSKDFVFTFLGKHVYVYDYSGRLLQTITVREEVNDVASTPDGRYLVVASEDMRVYLYEKVG